MILEHSAGLPSALGVAVRVAIEANGHLCRGLGERPDLVDGGRCPRHDLDPADPVPLMCAVWNSPGYQELERLLPLLRSGSPAGYGAVVAMYVDPSFRRRAVCPRCGAVAMPDHIGEPHRHGRIDEHWRGEAFIPRELQPLAGGVAGGGSAPAHAYSTPKHPGNVPRSRAGRSPGTTREPA